MQRLRPTLIALAILVLSATAALAASPARPASAPGSPHPQASHSPQHSKAPRATATAAATEASESSEPSDVAEAGHPVNHGCVVSLAAKTATPSGFKNHGQWVSSIAKNNHGHNKDGDNTTCALPTVAPAPSEGANPTTNP